MMAEPIASLADIEFPKNSIKIDKLTGFFRKFREIFEGKCAQMQADAHAKTDSGARIPPPPHPCAGKFCHGSPDLR